MSKIKQKSEFNLAAAKLLIENNYYAPSVHCSYYSCFQLLKYTIKNFCGLDYDMQSKNISSSKLHTHQYIINYITGKLKEKVNFQESRNFKLKIKDLKQFRLESDYENIEIGFEKSNKAYRIANEIRDEINRDFRV